MRQEEHCEDSLLQATPEVSAREDQLIVENVQLKIKKSLDTGIPRTYPPVLAKIRLNYLKNILRSISAFI